MDTIRDGFSLLDECTSPSVSGTGIYREPGYEGNIDYRIRQLSYSAKQLFNGCKRKFQLNRLKTSFREEENIESTVTFAYGHVIGDGIQKTLEGRSEKEILISMFLGWHAPLMLVDEKRSKSFWSALLAIQRFKNLLDSGFLKDYEVLQYNGKPATELSFCITLPDGFRFRGSVDCVLKHKKTGEILVLEAKSTWLPTNQNKYKNSEQGIGYSVVLDYVAPGLSSYDVLYLEYNSKTREYTPIKFPKSYLQRAEWIRTLLFDVEVIKLCEEEELYPKNGDYCTSFNRDCEYINTCGLSIEHMTKPCKEEDIDKKVYDITLTIADLLESQLERL